MLSQRPRTARPPPGRPPEQERALKILIVEDNGLVALSLAQAVRGLGLDVIGPVYTVQRALRLLAHGAPDAAILDYALLDGDADPVAACLYERGIPFAVLTGYSAHDIPPLAADTVLSKPVHWPSLEDFLSGLVTRRARSARTGFSPAAHAGAP